MNKLIDNLLKKLKKIDYCFGEIVFSFIQVMRAIKNLLQSPTLIPYYVLKVT